MRTVPATCLAFLLAVLAPPPVAHAQQALTLSFGGFAVNGEEARADGDVLLENRRILSFDIDDFNTGSVALDWSVPIGEYLEVAAGVGYAAREVPTVYSGFVNRNGAEIEQDIRLRIVPMTATARILPFGRSRAVQPYLGGGVAFLRYRYSEVGDFVDFTDRSVFSDRFVAEGTEAAPVVLAGLRFPVGDAWALGGEVRYQKAEADLNEDFLGPVLDLGGYHYLFTVQLKF